MCGGGADGADNDVCKGGAVGDQEEARKAKEPCGGVQKRSVNPSPHHL